VVRIGIVRTLGVQVPSIGGQWTTKEGGGVFTLIVPVAAAWWLKLTPRCAEVSTIIIPRTSYLY
jgi:hypothetical protein